MYPLLVPSGVFLYNTVVWRAKGNRAKSDWKEVTGVKRMALREQGQGLIEYAMIIVLVAIFVMILLLAFGGAIGNLFSNIIASI